ncbi:MAG: hypothetical protein R3Y56_04535 [Akkermansia sp.]
MLAAEPKTLFRNDTFTLTSHGLVQGESAATLTSPNNLRIKHLGEERDVTIPPADISKPGYRGDMPVLSALFKLASHELAKDVNEAGLMTAGVNWDGCWTRDTAYAMMLGACFSLPEACKTSLESRVRDGKVIQDTGTGGGWPISSDRVTWAEAAWIYYCQTGDQEWLAWSADVLRATFEQDELILQRHGQLFSGETSFIDWREQSYPDWMEPADIGASFSLSTNVMHAVARRLLSFMLDQLGQAEEAALWLQKAKDLRYDIQDKFWNSATRQYGMIRTLDSHLDERTDALGSALCVLSGIACEHAQETLNGIPESPFGTPAFSPYKSSQKDAYHNRSIWPFVEGLMLMAQVNQRDLAGVEQSIAKLLRAALLFGTNKENFHAVTGEARDTIQNSDGQLWSAAALQSIFYFALFGLRFEHGNLVFIPCVPKAYAGSHWLTGIRIRNTVLDIHITGYGTEVNSVLINGKPGMPIFPLDSLDKEGRLMLEFTLAADDDDETPYHRPEANEDLPEPHWTQDSSPTMLRWEPVEGAKLYRVFNLGKAIAQTGNCEFEPPASSITDRYRVQALNEKTCSCLSRPFDCGDEGSSTQCQPERIGINGEYHVEQGQAWLDCTENTSKLYYPAVDLEAGTYTLRFRYCNATASKRDGDSCAVRALFDGEELLGYIPFPHNTEAGQWQDFTLTAPFIAKLEAGAHEFSLRYTDACEKGTLNQLMVQHVEIKLRRVS